MSEISFFQLVSVAELAGMNLTLSETFLPRGPYATYMQTFMYFLQFWFVK